MKNESQLTWREAQGSLKKLLKERCPLLTNVDIEKLEVELLNYITTGIKDDYSIALAKERGEDLDIKILRLVEKYNDYLELEDGRKR